MRSNRKIVLHKLNFFANITMSVWVRVSFFSAISSNGTACIFYSNAYGVCWVCLSLSVLCKHKAVRGKNAFWSREEFNQISMLYSSSMRLCIFSQNSHCMRTAFSTFYSLRIVPDEEDYKSWYWNGNTSHICATILDSLYENQIRWILAWNFRIHSFFLSLTPILFPFVSEKEIIFYAENTWSHCSFCWTISNAEQRVYEWIYLFYCFCSVWIIFDWWNI